MITTREKSVRIDIGRLIMVPLSVLVVLRNAAVIYRGYQSSQSLHALDTLSQVNTILVTSFYVLMVVAYLWRTSAKQTSQSLAVNAIAVIATFMPALLLLAGAEVKSHMVLVLSGTVTATAGMGFSLYSLQKLGRSFSIIPQSRELVGSGPYRYLRHPLYAGEIIAMAGFVIAHFAVITGAIFVVIVVLQTYRAVSEERILASTFPSYEGYMARTWRFVPGIF